MLGSAVRDVEASSSLSKRPFGAATLRSAIRASQNLGALTAAMSPVLLTPFVSWRARSRRRQESGNSQRWTSSRDRPGKLLEQYGRSRPSMHCGLTRNIFYFQLSEPQEGLSSHFDGSRDLKNITPTETFSPSMSKWVIRQIVEAHYSYWKVDPDIRPISFLGSQCNVKDCLRRGDYEATLSEP